jgi:glutathione S-transferase
MLTLYALPVSLYSAKLRIALRCKGVAWREVPPPGGYGSAAYRAIVPSGTLPAIDEDRFVLAESEAIAEYLEETRPEPAMLRGDARARAAQRMLSRFHDTRLEPAVRALFAHVPRAARGDVATLGAAVSVRLAELAGIARPSPLLGGATLSLGDCGYPATFAWIEALSAALGFPVGWPTALDEWRAALDAHPAVAAEMAVYRPALAAWIAARTT